MKKMFLILATAALSLGSFAGNPDDNKNRDNNPPDKYCAEFKDGLLCVVHNGEALKEDITFANGAKLHTDGVITNKNGRAHVLKPGECVNMDGALEGGNVENKKAEEVKKPVRHHKPVSKHKKAK